MPDPQYVLTAVDLEVLDAALRALDDAAAVVDAGEDEAEAYEREKNALYALIKRLDPERASWSMPLEREVARRTDTGAGDIAPDEDADDVA